MCDLNKNAGFGDILEDKDDVSVYYESHNASMCEFVKQKIVQVKCLVRDTLA